MADAHTYTPESDAPPAGDPDPSGLDATAEPAADLWSVAPRFDFD